MNITNMLSKKRKEPPQRSKMVFQLWLIMMGLVFFTLAFMWVVQIFLFEQNYAEATLEESSERLKPVMEVLTSEDIAKDDKLLPFLSRITDGVLVLTGRNGELITLYAYGHAVEPNPGEPEYFIWDAIKNGDNYSDILNRTPYRGMMRMDGSDRHEGKRGQGGRIVAVEQGIPVTYGGQNCYLVIHQSINLQTIMNLNRRQLVVLSIFLTLAAAILAAVCSRHFTKPIYAIKDTIDRLAQNDFSAKPNLNRQDEFGQLAESVESLGQALNRVDVLRKEVIANVSHELRSPLAVIAGYAEMVRDISWADADKREEDLNLIISESQRMSEMVNDILDYSQLQSGYIRLNLVECNLCEIVETETFHCAAKAAEHDIRLDFQSELPEFFINADPLKLSQVLRNLLYNAINHTPEGGQIVIRLDVKAAGAGGGVKSFGNTETGGIIKASTSMKPGGNAKSSVNAEPGGSRIRLSVSNPGDPIPEEDRKIIWERYQRSQHNSGRNLGTGIGLSIVSTILDAHNMSYGVDCENGQTVFWFDCPYSSIPFKQTAVISR